MAIYKAKIKFTGKSRARAAKIQQGIADRKAKEKEAKK